MNVELDSFTDEELIEEIEARGAMPEPAIDDPDLGDFSDEEIAEEFYTRELLMDLSDVLRFIERELWTPSDWARLQDALAVAVVPRRAAA